MKHLVSSWTGRALAAAMVGLLWSTAASTAAAGTLQDNLLFKDDALLARPRLAFKLSYIHAHIRTTSKDARDVTGPVLARDDFANYLYANGFVSSFQSKGGDPDIHSLEDFYAPDDIKLASTLLNAMDAQADLTGCEAVRQGIGTPCGFKVKSDTTANTVALSLTYFLDAQYQWALEALVLGAPISASVYGDGNTQLRGKKIIETHLLPPIVTLGRYFGQPGSGLQPYVGLGVSYGIFYNTQATQTLNAYQGGSNEGDTSVSISNAWGAGPFMGLNYSTDAQGWQWGFSVGRLRFKPETTLVTRNTRFTYDSAALKDFGARLSSALVSADGIYSVSNPNVQITTKVDGAPAGYTAGQTVHVTTAVMCDLARAKYGSNDCNQGTFVRKASTTLDATLYMLSVGRRF
jgi:outer membrane protein W